MQIKSVLWLTRMSSVFSLALVVYLILFQVPYTGAGFQERSFLVISVFFAGVYAFIASLSVLFIFHIRKNLFEQDLWPLNFGIALRQGLLLSLGAVVLLVLQVFRVLVWWDGLLAVGAIFMIELYFLVR